MSLTADTMSGPSRGVTKKEGGDSRLEAVREAVVLAAASALNVRPGKIKPGEALFAADKVFDSFSVLELVIRLEQAFGLSIPDEDLDPEVFFSVETIAAYVLDRLNSGGR